MLTFGEFKTSSAQNILGVCPDSTQGKAKLNEGVEKLMRLGDWSGLVTPIQVCVYAGCAVFPRYVGAVRALNSCCDNTPISNQWYRFLPRECNYTWGGWSGNWWGTSSWGRHCRESCHAINNGTAQTFDSIRGEGRFVRVYPRCNADIGKTVTIFGVDNYGVPLHTRDSSDNWTDGIVLTLAKPFTSTSIFVRRIDKILKEETQCIVDVYGYWADEDALEPIGHYEPSETVPSYIRMQIPNGWNGCCGLRSVAALVKLRHIPIKVDSDLVLIDNLAALKLIIQSGNYADEGNLQASQAYELDAIRLLNRQLSDDSPLDQLPVQIRTFSGTGIGRQKCW